MTSDNDIKQETFIPHEQMTEAIEEWRREIGLDELPEESQQALLAVFRDGWSLCLHHTMRPARDLSMMLLQMVEMGRKQTRDDPKVVLGKQALEAIESLCHEVVGMPADWQLDDIVEAVQVTDPDEIAEIERQLEHNGGKEDEGDGSDR